MSTLKRSPPMAIVIFLERCDSLFQMFLKELSADHDEQHFELGCCSHRMRPIRR
jgi:hypothetical protein